MRSASESLDAVRANAAWLLHTDNAPVEDVVAYLERWGPLPRVRAEKAVEFLTSPTWRAYISCYVEGYPLCRDFVAGDPTRFATLLTEQSDAKRIPPVTDAASIANPVTAAITPRPQNLAELRVIENLGVVL